jgi:hypothetical protein
MPHSGARRDAPDTLILAPEAHQGSLPLHILLSLLAIERWRRQLKA